MTTSLRFAWRNIWRNPRRTILTILAISFGAALLVFSIGLQLGQYDLMIANNVRVFQGLLQIQRGGYLDDARMRTSIPRVIARAQDIRDKTKIDDVAARAHGFALVSSDTRTYGSMIVGVEPEYEPKVSIIPGLVKEGRYFTGNEARELVLGRSLAKNMQVTIGDEVTLLGSGRDGSVAAVVLEVVGIFNSGSADLDRSLVEIPLLTFQDVFGMEDHGHAIVLYHKDVSRVEALQRQLSAIVGNTDNLVVLRWDEIQPGLKEAIELDYASGWFMYAVLVAIITFSIMNTFLMSVMERTREFGIMLALGYRPWNIGKLVMLEALMLTLIALAFGTSIGVMVNLYYYYNGLTFSGMEEIAQLYNMPASITPQISFKAIVIGPLFILAFTLLAALYPAMRIRRLHPVDAMRKL